MPLADEQSNPTSQAIPWRRVWPCVIVFTAVFILFGSFWPARSPGVRASVSVDFCLPHDISELTLAESEQLKSTIAAQVSRELDGPKFEALIWQTKRTGNVVSSAIEYFDRETIASNIQLGFAFNPNGGRMQLQYLCQGQPDEVRFLQLLSHQLATSIDNLLISTDSGIVFNNQFNNQKFERAIWLANQVQSDLSEIRQNHHTEDQSSPYSFASTTHIATEEPITQRRTVVPDDLSSIAADSLSSLLDEIKTQTHDPNTGDATFSILNVNAVKTSSINATPSRWAMFGLLVAAGLVTGFVATYQVAPAKSLPNMESLSRSLGIPVVAVLTTDQPSKQHLTTADLMSSVADKIVFVAKIFLTAIALVVIGFALIDPSIRESIIQNPFDGVAKIFRVFFGYA